MPAFARAGPLAQLVEQLTLNQRVKGSSPLRPTSHIKDLDENRGLDFTCGASPGHHKDVIGPAQFTASSSRGLRCNSSIATAVLGAVKVILIAG
jgi:hypothetical protein